MSIINRSNRDEYITNINDVTVYFIPLSYHKTSVLLNEQKKGKPTDSLYMWQFKIGNQIVNQLIIKVLKPKIL